MQKKKKKGYLPEDVALQRLMLPTTETSLIQINYTAEVHLYHSGLTWSSKVPPVSFPLTIHPGSTIDTPILQGINKSNAIPKNWNPKIYKPLEVKVDMQQ